MHRASVYFSREREAGIDEYLPGIHVRRKIVGKYILFYQVLKEEKVIRILRIVYGRRDMDEVLKHVNS